MATANDRPFTARSLGRRREDHLRARLAALVYSSADAIIGATLAGIITEWNPAAERLFGYPAQEIIGQSLLLLVPPERRAEAEAILGRARRGESVAAAESVRWTKAGRRIEVSLTVSPIWDDAGTIVATSAIVRDISDRKLLERQLRTALEAAQAGIRTRTLFLAMMSHELRTPLQAVLGYADFLLNGPPGSLTPAQREDIGAIRQGAGRMVTLIDQLLDLSRMEAGRLELAAEPVVLETILDQVRQDVAPQVIANALAFSIHLPPALPPVRGDALRVRQILLNLVGNAVKFTEAGAVTITAHRAAGGVTVVVRDTGIGISAEALPHIFEEFRQVDSRPTRRYGGAGLGLAIAKKLAEQMGGRLSVESTLGAGSTFALWLPVAPRK
jgi:PAS domain S-box-containing protein